MKNYTQVCRQGASRGLGKPGVVLRGDDACSGGWVYQTPEAQPCPSCRRPLSVLGAL